VAERPDRLLFDEHNRVELRALADAGTVALVPVGATEQHGPHLPVGTDAWHVEHVARAAAARVAAARADRGGAGGAGVLVTPTLPFGSSPHHLPFGGTISIPTATYFELLVAILESLVTDGFRRIFLVNGHGGNHELIQVAARDVALKHPVVIAAGSWWNVAWDVLVEAGGGEVGRLPGHAGGFETSLVMAMRPDVPLGAFPTRAERAGPSADPRRFSPLVRTEVHDFWPSVDGYSDGPARASREAGERFLEVSIAELARRIEALAATALPD
jgi:creatinine amidohydrolase